MMNVICQRRGAPIASAHGRRVVGVWSNGIRAAKTWAFSVEDVSCRSDDDGGFRGQLDDDRVAHAARRADRRERDDGDMAQRRSRLPVIPNLPTGVAGDEEV